MYAIDPMMNGNKDSTRHIVENRYSPTRLINPLLDCSAAGHSTLRDFMEMESAINQEIYLQYKEKNAQKISVYYRQLNNGHWIGVSENDKYSPASLLKLPVLIAAIKHLEANPDFLKMKVLVENTQESYLQSLGNNNFNLVKGQEYTIEDLLEFMIVYSDNQSKDLILQRIPTQTIQNVFYDLGIDIFKYQNFEKSLSVKEYASYYRILYNATYLSKDNSHKALELLTRTRFKLGLVAGVPSDVTVAHKFGERDFGVGRQKQLHDCGIVYCQGNPYIICIMAVGQDFDKLEKAISNLSNRIYKLSLKK